MAIKDFILGVVTTMLIGAVIFIAVLLKQINKLKSNKAATPPTTCSESEGIEAGDSSDILTEGNTVKADIPKKTPSNKKKAYPDASCIPLEWFDSVYRLKNDWVNKKATANLLQIKTFGNLGEVTVIVNCKFADKKPDGFRLILEDPYETIKTELIPIAKVTVRDGKFNEDDINSFIGNILIVKGISERGKFRVKEISHTEYSRKCI